MFYEQAINGVVAPGNFYGPSLQAPHVKPNQSSQPQSLHSQQHIANNLYFGFLPQQQNQQAQAFNFSIQNRQNSQDFLNTSQNEKSWLNSSLNEKNWLNNSLNLPSEQR